MGPAGAANIIFKKDEDKDAKTAKYVEEFATPYKAAERGFVDVVIEPKQNSSSCYQRVGYACK